MSNKDILLKNGANLMEGLLDFIKKSSNLSIYVPYVKLEQLQNLLSRSTQVNTIIVRWEVNDLILGSSDLEVYPFLKERGIKLYCNPRLHLKAFVDNYERAFISSANISQRALNFPETSNYNYELGVIIDDLTRADRLYFQTIEAESTLITDEIYIQLKTRLSQIQFEIPKDFDFHFKSIQEDKNFSISSLPMSHDIGTLIRIYLDETSLNEIDLNCAIHDLAIYKIPFGLSKTDFVSELKSSFFKHPFIKGFLSNVENIGEIYFGSAKEWIHQNCSDAPIPRKWEITSNIQILYRWIVSLSDGVYEIDRPNYSERLFKVIQTDEQSLYHENFINELNRDKARGAIAPHQIILLISCFNLYHATSREQFDFTELADEFYTNWKKHQHLFKSKNNNIGMPLKALNTLELVTNNSSQPIANYRNTEELSQKIKSIHFNTNLIKFLKTVDLNYLESRINK